MTGADLGGHGNEALGQLLDRYALHSSVQDVADPLAGDEARPRKIEIEEAQHLAARQLAREFFEGGQLAGHVATADHGADRGAGDDVRVDAGLVQRAQNPDVRPPAGRPASKRQADLAITHCWVPGTPTLTRLARPKGRSPTPNHITNHSAERLSERYGRRIESTHTAPAPGDMTAKSKKRIKPAAWGCRARAGRPGQARDRSRSAPPCDKPRHRRPR